MRQLAFGARLIVDARGCGAQPLEQRAWTVPAAGGIEDTPLDGQQPAAVAAAAAAGAAPLRATATVLCGVRVRSLWDLPIEALAYSAAAGAAAESDVWRVDAGDLARALSVPAIVAELCRVLGLPPLPCERPRRHEQRRARAGEPPVPCVQVPLEPAAAHVRQLVLVEGPCGAGKSTICRTLLGQWRANRRPRAADRRAARRRPAP